MCVFLTVAVDNTASAFTLLKFRLVLFKRNASIRNGSLVPQSVALLDESISRRYRWLPEYLHFLHYVADLYISGKPQIEHLPYRTHTIMVLCMLSPSFAVANVSAHNRLRTDNRNILNCADLNSCTCVVCICVKYIADLSCVTRACVSTKQSSNICCWTSDMHSVWRRFIFG